MRERHAKRRIDLKSWDVAGVANPAALDDRALSQSAADSLDRGVGDDRIGGRDGDGRCTGRDDDPHADDVSGGVGLDEPNGAGRAGRERHGKERRAASVDREDPCSQCHIQPAQGKAPPKGL